MAETPTRESTRGQTVPDAAGAPMAGAPTSPSPSTAPGGASGSGTVPGAPSTTPGSSLARTTPGYGSRLQTERGTTVINDVVVEKIAGLSARQVRGVAAMGGRTSGALGAIKGMVGSGPSPTQGVSVEVGERQAAIDIDLIVEYGVPIVDLAEAVRRNIVNQVQGMTGLEVTEVNITVNDVQVATEEPEPRVQ